MFNSINKSFKYGNHIVTLETGIIARKSYSSVLAKMDDTIVLIAIVKSNNKLLNNKFLPLTVNYYEKAYSVGKFPGGFLRREIKQTENEIIISRLIDRSIRPLFNKDYQYEIQITITALSINPNIMPDIISIIGVSTALEISNIPFNGPISACRIGYINNNFVLNPSYEQLKISNLDLIISNTNESLIMIESSSNFLSEDEIINSIKFGLENSNIVLDNIKNFRKCIYLENKNKIINNIYINPLYLIISKFINKELLYIYNNINDLEIKINKLNKLKKEIIFQINNLINLNNKSEIENIFNLLEREIIRNKIIKDNIRIDKRLFDEVRKIDSKISILPRVHGSSLFTRGETQALVSVTLGNEKNAQNIENLLDINNFIDKFIFHYNFPPYCVGEIGSLGFPKRREIGHGKLAKKSILPIIPDIKKFPYTLRIVSEITESNGSSSMASVCGASLALMDAGVPIKSIVSGIAMGLIIKNDKKIILTDISGDEDFLGDIDFKISGDEFNITALQMDIKINGIELSLIKEILIKSRYARIKILNEMKKTISNYKSQLSIFAPKIYTIKININKIKDLIGKGGNVIKNIISQTKSDINVDEYGIVKITALNDELAKQTIDKILEITNDIIINKIYLGIVIKILNIGILFLINNNKEGLMHISYLNKIYKNNVLKNFNIGQKFSVKVINIDKFGKIRLIFNEIINFNK